MLVYFLILYQFIVLCYDIYCRITYFNQISYANIFYYMSGGGSEGGAASLLDIYSHVFRTNWVITGFVNKYSYYNSSW